MMLLKNGTNLRQFTNSVSSFIYHSFIEQHGINISRRQLKLLKEYFPVFIGRIMIEEKYFYFFLKSRKI